MHRCYKHTRGGTAKTVSNACRPCRQHMSRRRHYYRQVQKHHHHWQMTSRWSYRQSHHQHYHHHRRRIVQLALAQLVQLVLRWELALMTVLQSQTRLGAQLRM